MTRYQRMWAYVYADPRRVITVIVGLLGFALLVAMIMIALFTDTPLGKVALYGGGAFAVAGTGMAVALRPRKPADHDPVDQDIRL